MDRRGAMRWCTRGISLLAIGVAASSACTAVLGYDDLTFDGVTGGAGAATHGDGGTGIGGTGGGGDGGAGGQPGCGLLSPGFQDVYVDDDADDELIGTEACPFATIADALSAIGDAPGVTIHVAEGVYLQTTSLVFNKSLTLEGAGAGLTIIRGSSPYPMVGYLAELEALGTDFSPAIVVANPTDQVAMRGFTLEPALDEAEGRTIGILCQQGNALPTVVPPPDPYPVAPSALIEDLEIAPGAVAPGFTFGIVIASPDAPLSGCNLAVSDTVIRDNAIGIWAVNYKLKPTAAADIGPGVAISGHTGAALLVPGTLGLTPAGVFLSYDGVSPFNVHGNTFTENAIGIFMGAADEGYSEVRGNTIEDGSGWGIALNENSKLDLLLNNTIQRIGPSPSSGRGAGVLVGGTSRIVKARGNSFLNNDTGVEFTSLTGVNATDFGNAGNLGLNKFHCNSYLASAGYDVAVSSDDATPLLFIGNTWDHSPPTAGTGPAANGTDVWTSGMGAVDSNNPTEVSIMCDAGRVR